MRGRDLENQVGFSDAREIGRELKPEKAEKEAPARQKEIVISTSMARRSCSWRSRKAHFSPMRLRQSRIPPSSGVRGLTIQHASSMEARKQLASPLTSHPDRWNGANFRRTQRPAKQEQVRRQARK